MIVDAKLLILNRRTEFIQNLHLGQENWLVGQYNMGVANKQTPLYLYETIITQHNNVRCTEAYIFTNYQNCIQ